MFRLAIDPGFSVTIVAASVPGTPLHHHRTRGEIGAVFKGRLGSRRPGHRADSTACMRGEQGQRSPCGRDELVKEPGEGGVGQTGMAGVKLGVFSTRIRRERKAAAMPLDSSSEAFNSSD